MAIAAAAAIFLDWLIPTRNSSLHPVALLGRILGLADRLRPKSSFGQFIAGFSLCLVSIGLVIATAGLLSNALQTITVGDMRLPEFFQLSFLAVAFAPSFSVTLLLEAADKIHYELEHKNIDRARTLLSYNLVSRDTSSATEADICSATISSVSENAVDSFIGSLFYFMFFGLAGAWAYRVVNTGDAMFGYRTEKNEWFGKCFAILDDIVNFIPSRITGFVLLPLSYRLNDRNSIGPKTIYKIYRDTKRTPSPNGGWPMAATAWILGIKLYKPNTYQLNENARAPLQVDILRANLLLNDLRWVAISSMSLLALLAFRQ